MASRTERSASIAAEHRAKDADELFAKKDFGGAAKAFEEALDLCPADDHALRVLITSKQTLAAVRNGDLETADAALALLTPGDGTKAPELKMASDQDLTIHV